MKEGVEKMCKIVEAGQGRVGSLIQNLRSRTGRSQVVQVDRAYVIMHPNSVIGAQFQLPL